METYNPYYRVTVLYVLRKNDRRNVLTETLQFSLSERFSVINPNRSLA